jgi:hypothetical protein
MRQSVLLTTMHLHPTAALFSMTTWPVRRGETKGFFFFICVARVLSFYGIFCGCLQLRVNRDQLGWTNYHRTSCSRCLIAATGESIAVMAHINIPPALLLCVFICSAAAQCVTRGVAAASWTLTASETSVDATSGNAQRQH